MKRSSKDTMAKMLFELWWILALTASLATCLSGSSTLKDHTEYHQRLHVFTVSEDTNTTSLTYTNTGAESDPVVVTFESPLPPSLFCGADYDRCNILITSNTDESIRVTLLPLESGIGMVSFNYSTRGDSLSFREQFLLPHSEPNCTFVYFVDELIGYCLELDPATIRAFQIRINFTDLTASLIHRRDGTFEDENLNNINSLSNFLYFVRHEFDECFSNEGNHVIFLDNGDLLDHSFMDGDILFSHVIQVDRTCSKLHRVGDACGLAAHCDGKVVLFDTRQHVELISFTEAEYGQTFFCPSGDFVRFEYEVLSLHHRNRRQFGNNVSFPFGDIHQGHCLNVDDKFFFVATIDDNSTCTVLVNFTDASYQHLGGSDLSTVVLARVKGDIAVVNTGSATEIYNLGLGCVPEPLVLHERNFVLATFFMSETMDLYWCLDRGPAPVDGTVTIPISTTPMSDPVNSRTSSLQVIIGVVAGTVVVVLLVTLGCVIALCVGKPYILAWINKRNKKPPADSELSELNPESPLPCPGKPEAGDTDQKSNSAMDSFESQETLEPLLNSRPTTSNEVHTLPETSTVNSKSNGDGFNGQLTSETIADLYSPRLECIEDVPTTVYQNSQSRDQPRDGNYATTDAGDLHHSASDLHHSASDLHHSASDLHHSASDLHHSASDLRHSAGDLHHSASDLNQGASKEKIPVLCTESPRRNAMYSFQGNSVPPHSTELSVLESHTSHQSSTTAYQENRVRLQSSELHGVGVEGHSGRPCSTVSEGSCTAAAACVLPIQEARSDYDDRGYMVGVQAPSPNFDRHDVKKVYKGMDSQMNEQERVQYVDAIVNGDSQSQNSEPNNDTLLDRQGSNDSQENEN